MRHLRKNIDIINNYDLKCENINDSFEDITWKNMKDIRD